MIKRILILMTAAVLLCSCGGKANEEQNEVEEKTILLEVWGPQEKQAFLNDKITQFQNQNTDQQFEIRLTVEALETVRDTVLTDPAAAADVFLIQRADADTPSRNTAPICIGETEGTDPQLKTASACHA